MKRILVVSAVAAGLAIASACGPAQETRNAAVAPSNANGNKAENPFTPGSAADVITNQPDYQADVTTVTGPTKIVAKVAKKGGNWRMELPLPPPVGKSIYYIRAGQPTLMVLPERKQYAELGEGGDSSLVNPLASTLEGLQQKGVRFEKLGTEVVDGHPTTKYRGTKEGEDAEMTVFTADDLKNMIIRIDARRENVPFSITWSNISLDVPDGAVAPPVDLTSGFTKIDASAFGREFSAGAGSAPAGTPAPPRP